jgi:signal transduction histidine kinase
MAHCLAEIKEHRDTLQHYLNEDPRGEKVLTFMSSLTRSLLESIDPMNDATRKIGSAIDYIADILTIQQGYAVREHESRETTDVNALIRNALRMQTSALQKRGIEAILDLDPQLPKVLIDKGRLMQVLVNLVVNAYEAIDEMDTTDPRREIVMRTRHRDGQILIHIADSGIGVAPEDLGAVFDLGKSHKGSSGFGLYYCEKFISASGGTITIESAGRRAGATVSISLPAGDVSVRQITTTKTSQRI